MRTPEMYRAQLKGGTQDASIEVRFCGPLLGVDAEFAKSSCF